MNVTTGTLVQTAAWSPARAYALEAKYEFLKVLRMPGYAIPSIAFPAMFYLLFGVMFGRGNGRRPYRWRLTSSPPTARSASSARRSSGSASASPSSVGRAG